ncbi:hypothetical protein OC834_000496 [Tilletia horrida]|nr:hypothetical protein OC834_000496 [Tilletia horrida]
MPLQDISNMADGDLSLDILRQRPFDPEPEWRDDTTLMDDGHSSAVGRVSKRDQHLAALSKVSQYAQKTHQNALAQLIEGIAQAQEPSVRSPAARSSIEISPGYRYSSPKRELVEKKLVPSRRNLSTHNAKADISTWSDSDEDFGDKTRPRTPSPTTQAFDSRASRSTQEQSSAAPMQSTPPRPSSASQSFSPARAKAGPEKPAPTLAQRRLVRRALGSPEVDAPWNSSSSTLHDRSSRSCSTQQQAEKQPLPARARSHSVSHRSLDRREVTKQGLEEGDEQEMITPIRGMKLASAILAATTPSIVASSSPASVQGGADDNAADDDYAPPLDLRGLEGIRQRTRYGKVHVLPLPDLHSRSYAAEREQRSQRMLRTVLIALRGEARGVAIQAEVELQPAAVSRAGVLSRGSALSPARVTVSVGVLGPRASDSDMPGHLEKWHSWDLDGSDGADGPPEWVLRVYAHLCRWAQRRRTDLLQRVQA